jgi:hydrogenase/urease accessory protein HupE
MRKLLYLTLLFGGVCFFLAPKAQAHPFNYGAVKTQMQVEGSKIYLKTSAPQNIKFNGNQQLYLHEANDYFSKNLVVTFDNEKCQLALSAANASSATRSVFAGTYKCSRPIAKLDGLLIHSELFNGYFASIDHYVTLSLNGRQTRLVFNQQHQDYPKNVKPIPSTALGRFFAVEKQFIWLGITHIWTGYDHILFLVSIVLLVRSVKKILILVTSFTVAHSITLILAGLHIITVSPRIVEPLIALTILYMSARNIQLLLKNKKVKNIAERQAATTGFGLIHGLGFAGALLATSVPKDFFVPSLLFFNIGVEIGQLCILLILVPLLFWSRKLTWQRHLLLTISGLTAWLAVLWLVERIFLY